MRPLTWAVRVGRDRTVAWLTLDEANRLCRRCARRGIKTFVLAR